MTTADFILHPAAGLPIGRPVEPPPARRPTRTTFAGRPVTVSPLDPAAHLEALYQGTHGGDRERLWLYLGEGPFADLVSFGAACNLQFRYELTPPPVRIALQAAYNWSVDFEVGR
jgi:hypothetical protein